MSSYNLSPVYLTPQFSNSGQLLVGGKIYWYLGGTTTPVTVYQDNQGLAAHTQPIILDARGEPPAPIWLLGGQTYKAVLQDSSGNQLQVIDNITGVGDVTFASSSVTQLTINSTGNGAKLFQGVSGDLEIATNQNSGTPKTWKFGDVFTFPDGSTMGAGQYTGFRNRIINGAMKIDQRNNGAAQTIANGSYAYTVDRWRAAAFGATCSGQRTGPLNGQQYIYQFTGNAGITNINFNQRIESFHCYDLASKTATLSVSLANSLLTSVTWTVSYATAVDNFTSITQIATGAFTVNSTFSQYAIQVALPANTINGLQIDFTVGAQTSGVWQIGQVQFERGSTATPFEFRPYGAELALCQRYYEVFSSTWSGNSTATAAYYAMTPFSVSKRASATLTSIAQAALGNGGFGTRISAGSGTNSAIIQATASGTTNSAGWTDSWSASAEL